MLGRIAAKSVVVILLAAAACAAQTAKPAADPVPAPGSPEEARILKSTESFVRTLFAWGPDIAVKLGPLGQSASRSLCSELVVVTGAHIPPAEGRGARSGLHHRTPFPNLVRPEMITEPRLP